MRHRVTLQKPSGAVDAMNAPTGAYADVTTVWAYIEYGVGDELEEASQQVNKETAFVTIRFYPGLTATWRLKYGNRIFNVVSSTDWGEKHIWHQLKCTEIDGTSVAAGGKC